MTASLPPSKPCSKCGAPKPLTEYERAKKASDGRASSCKACAKLWREANKERLRQKRKERYEANKEEMRERARQWREANPEYQKKYFRVYYLENKARLKQHMRQYYEANKERMNEQARQHYQANKERFLEYGRNRRARVRGAQGKHSFEEIWQMLEDQAHMCAYCEIPLMGAFQVDHMLPLFRGGSNDWSNLAITCQRCNYRKRTKTAEEFMEYLRQAS